MTNKSYTTGPGILKIGTDPDEQNWEAQVTSVTVEWDVDAEDDENVLSGETVPGDEVYTATLSGNAYQDISATGMTRYSWAHKGETLPVEFIPNTVEDVKITGNIKMRPITVGGDVKAKAKSDFEFPFVGEPVMDDVTP